MYARDGAWWYLLVDSATCDCRVVARTIAGTRDLGAPEARGTTSTLFVTGVPRPASIALVDRAGSTVADAPLIYTAR